MVFLSMVLSSSPRIQNHPKARNFFTSKPNSRQLPFPFSKSLTFRNHPLLPNGSSLTKTSIPYTVIRLFTSLPCLASETILSQTEQVSDKINLETIVVSIDDFFNRHPFFVAGCTFIWLVVVPLTQEYLSKCKFISVINAFRKLRDIPDAQLLDIRNKKSLEALGSPNLKLLNKNVIQVEFAEEGKDGFVKKVLEQFQDPANTVLCILDDFDGNSMQVAELLVNSGFKEAYAMRGGVLGKSGWLAIQETLLPPSVHIYSKTKKKKKKAQVSQLGINGQVARSSEDKNDASTPIGFLVGESQSVDNGHENSAVKSTTHTKIGSRSPYPNYPDLRPPSSPTPSKP